MKQMRVVNQSTDRDRVNRGNRVKQKEVAAATFRAAETEEQRENRVEQIRSQPGRLEQKRAAIEVKPGRSRAQQLVQYKQGPGE